MIEITRLDVRPYAIPFRRPFVTATATFTHRRGAIVRIVGRDGYEGYGEAAAHPAAPADVLDSAITALRSLAPCDANDLAGADLPAPARVALETALLDLEARRRGVPLAQLLGSPCRSELPLNATLSRTTADTAATDARAAVARGFGCIKVKAAAGAEHDDAVLRAIRAAVGPRIALRIDVNGGESVEHSVAALRRWAKFNPEYVEQPVAEIADLARVRKSVSVRIAADESVSDESALDRILAAQAADVIVVKPSLLGLRASVRIAERAVHAGLDVVITSILESSVGIAAALHVAAVVPARLLACGLATAELLAADTVGEPLVVRNGAMQVPSAPGLGVVPA